MKKIVLKTVYSTSRGEILTLAVDEDSVAWFKQGKEKFQKITQKFVKTSLRFRKLSPLEKFLVKNFLETLETTEL